MSKESRELEILVAKIQSQLAPGAEVLHDAKLPGRHSGRSRQIDVLVRQRIGQYELLIVLECRDTARPVDVKAVEEFYGLLTDVGAHKGALVCPRGFTAAAKTRATGLQVNLYSPIDTDPHKWQALASCPVLCDFRSALMSFGVCCSAPIPFKIPQDFFSSSTAFDSAERLLGTPFTTAVSKWNEGNFPTTPGDHLDLPIFDQAEAFVDNGYGTRAPVTLTISLKVEQQLYFGQLPIPRISGFRDELSGAVITNAFTVGLLSPDEVMRDWTPIRNASDLPMPPVLKLTGLLAWTTDELNLPTIDPWLRVRARNS